MSQISSRGRHTPFDSATHELTQELKTALAVVRPLIEGLCLEFSFSAEDQSPVIDYRFNSQAVDQAQWNNSVQALAQITGILDKDIMLRVLCDLVAGNQLGQSTLSEYCRRFKIPNETAVQIGLRDILPPESNPPVDLHEQIIATVDFLKQIAALGSACSFEYQFTRHTHYRSFL